jgi:hypothetical protein
MEEGSHEKNYPCTGLMGLGETARYLHQNSYQYDSNLEVLGFWTLSIIPHSKIH